ncbi:MAG: glycosyltransferase [Schleiferiaceae bacterium]
MTVESIAYIWVGALSIQILFSLLFSRLALASRKGKDGSSHQHMPPVSIIVCGRNEEVNFARNLPLLLNQKYPEFEVVAVNDQSRDDSEEVLDKISKTTSRLRVVNVPENDQFWKGKKFGLTLGIKAAKYPNLLFIDADCQPRGEHWIQKMATSFTQKEVVLGYGGYKTQPTLLNALIQWETTQTAVHYLSAALWGMPYMGVGRNMGYTSELFFKHKGFVRHMHIPSGDDDLFIQSAATKENVTVVLDRDSHTLSDPKESFADWFQQKRRHYSTSSEYKFIHRLWLGLYFSTLILSYVGWIPALFLEGYLAPWILTIALSRWGIAWIVYAILNYQLSRSKALYLFPVIEALSLGATSAQQLLNLSFGKPQRW